MSIDELIKELSDYSKKFFLTENQQQSPMQRLTQFIEGLGINCDEQMAGLTSSLEQSTTSATSLNNLHERLTQLLPPSGYNRYLLTTMIAAIRYHLREDEFSLHVEKAINWLENTVLSCKAASAADQIDAPISTSEKMYSLITDLERIRSTYKELSFEERSNETRQNIINALKNKVRLFSCSDEFSLHDETHTQQTFDMHQKESFYNLKINQSRQQCCFDWSELGKSIFLAFVKILMFIPLYISKGIKYLCATGGLFNTKHKQTQMQTVKYNLSLEEQFEHHLAFEAM